MHLLDKHLDEVKKSALLRLTLACFVLGVLAIFSTNTLLTIAGLGVLPLFFLLLWRPGEPPVLLFAVCYQWLQVFVPIISANFHEIQIGEDIPLDEMEVAAWLGLLTVLVLALGMRIGVGFHWRVSYAKLESLSQHIQPTRVFLGYIIAFSLTLGLKIVVSKIPLMAQLLNAFEASRWILIFIILWLAVNHQQFRFLALVVVGIEIAIGFLGFFSGFKLILFLAVVVVAGQQVRQVRFFNPMVLILVSFVVLLGLFWQTIKPDYRDFLNQGTGKQVVLVSIADRAEFIIQRIPEVNSDDLQAAVESTINRIGYIEFFARTIRMVPSVIPHEEGKLWGQVAEHVFAPRIFFPDKANVNDSDRTNMYTDIHVAGADRGTSIGIGYAAENYIDYGKFVMFIPILGLGIFFGLCYRWLVTSTPYHLLGLATATVFILKTATLFESSNIKIVGGSLVFMMVWLSILTIVGKRVWEFIVAGKTRGVS